MDRQLFLGYMIFYYITQRTRSVPRYIRSNVGFEPGTVVTVMSVQ